MVLLHVTVVLDRRHSDLWWFVREVWPVVTMMIVMAAVIFGPMVLYRWLNVVTRVVP